MKCVICRQGQTGDGVTTVTFVRDSTTLVIKNVPARVCGNCGEAYVDEAITTRLLKTAEDASRAGVQVEVREYATA